MNYLEKVNARFTEVENLIELLKEYGDKYSEYVDSLESVSNILDGVKEQTTVEFKPKEYIRFSEAIEASERLLQNFINNNSRSNLPGGERNIYDAFQRMSNMFNDEVFTSVKQSSRMHRQFLQDYANNHFEERIKGYKENLAAYMKKPSVDDCLNLSGYNQDVDKSFRHISWLMLERCRAMSLNLDVSASFYDKTINRFFSELREAPLDIQTKFSWRLLEFKEALKDICQDKLNELRERYPQNPDNPDHMDLINLKYTPEYLLLESFNQVNQELMDSFVLGEVGVFVNFNDESVISYGDIFGEKCASLGFDKDEQLNFQDRASNEIGELIGGQMLKTVLRIPGYEQPGNTHDVEAMMPALVSSGYVQTEAIDGIIDLYEGIIKNPDLESTNFTNVRNKLQAFINQDHSGDCFTQNYKHKLDEAVLAAADYLDTHSGLIISSLGRARYSKSVEIVKRLTEYKGKLLTLEANRPDLERQEEGIAREEPENLSHESLFFGRLDAIKKDGRLSPEEKELESDIVGSEYQMAIIADSMKKASPAQAKSYEETLTRYLAKYMAQLTVKYMVQKQNPGAEIVKDLMSNKTQQDFQDTLINCGLAKEMMDKLIEDGADFHNLDGDKITQDLANMQRERAARALAEKNRSLNADSAELKRSSKSIERQASEQVSLLSTH